MKILVVDDSRTYQAMLCSYVANMGFEHVSAMNGDQALEIFHIERPDLILLDVTMPGIDGYEVARRLRAMHEEWALLVPIIFLSGLIRDEDIVEGIEAGGDDYLAKPISDIVLHAKIKAMMRMADQRRVALENSVALEKANEKLAHLNKCDGLTGIYNKRYFLEYLQQQWLHGRRNNSPISLLFIDVDFFKPYNDNYGHLEGDSCLKQVANALKMVTHCSADLLFRYGGEEFAFILPDTDHQGMCEIGEAAVQALRDAKIPHAYSAASDVVTISVGGVCMTPGRKQNPEMLITQSDQCVYLAKEQGRNRFIPFKQDV
ncbi:MAG: diguanylate cyclase [Mariprofundus sp.]|nr:diguanylate cyclase [Mariprofundus sp.]